MKRVDAPDHPPHLPINRAQLLKLLPFGEPWLLLDRVISLRHGVSLSAEYVVSEDHPAVRAHFAAAHPIMPGVLLIEMVGQAALALQVLSVAQSVCPPLLAQCRASFKCPVTPPATLRIEVRLVDRVGAMMIAEGRILANDTVVCEVQTIGVIGNERELS